MKSHKYIVPFSALLTYGALTYMIISSTTFAPEDWQEETGGRYDKRDPDIIVRKESDLRRVEEYVPSHVDSNILSDLRKDPDYSSGNSSRNLREVMLARKSHLLAKCREFNVLKDFPLRPWTTSTFTRNNTFAICVAPKVGTNAWQKVFEELRLTHINGYHPDLSSMTTRHPLDRLVSAYRDKYVNGDPIYKYEVTRKKNGSVQKWNFRWMSYWLPALISKGLVDSTPEFITAIEKYTKDFQHFDKIIERDMITENVTGKLSKLTQHEYGALARKILRDKISVSFPTPKTNDHTQKILKAMFRYGKNAGMRAAIEEGYPKVLQDQLRHKFSNVSFTFSDFLNHIIWTFDVGMEDQHWSPMTHLCDPCRMKFDNIIRMENSQEESKYILSHLGIKDEIHLTWAHKALNDSGKPYLTYFKNISKYTIERIQNIYKLDFTLLNYTMLEV